MDRERLIREHRNHVRAALRSGEHVPPHVLADYPKLADAHRRLFSDDEHDDPETFSDDGWVDLGPDGSAKLDGADILVRLRAGR